MSSQLSTTCRGSSRTTLDTSEPEPSVEEIEHKPWKFIGYKGYTDFIASEDDFHIFRRFGTLNTRISLLLQDEISALEDRLLELDKASTQRSAGDSNNGTMRNDPLFERATLLQDISQKIHRYSRSPTSFGTGELSSHPAL